MTTIKEKLSSRKLWVGIVLITIGVVLLFVGERDTGIQLITIGGAGYLGVEGLADIVSRFVNAKDKNDTDNSNGVADESQDL